MCGMACRGADAVKAQTQDWSTSSCTSLGMRSSMHLGYLNLPSSCNRWRYQVDQARCRNEGRWMGPSKVGDADSGPLLAAYKRTQVVECHFLLHLAIWCKHRHRRISKSQSSTLMEFDHPPHLHHCHHSHLLLMLKWLQGATYDSVSSFIEFLFN